MNKVKIAIASDHGGYLLKNYIYNYLLEAGYKITDFGTNSDASCNYPVFAKKVANLIKEGQYAKGILICGTGLGMQITANRTKKVRAVCVSDTYSARLSREHNNSNILCLGQRVVGEGLAKEIVDVWLNTDFLGERHLRRIAMIDEELILVLIIFSL